VILAQNDNEGSKRGYRSEQATRSPRLSEWLLRSHFCSPMTFNDGELAKGPPTV